MKNNIMKFFSKIGLGWINPLLKLFTGENPKEQVSIIWNGFGIPLTAIILFLLFWSYSASKINTSLGKLPGPKQVYAQSKALVHAHFEEREKAEVFYQKQVAKNKIILKNDPNADVKIREYTGKSTYLDQIITSLYTVFAGFVLASLIAVPIGLLCGVSKPVMAGLNPLIQIFKPVSPLAWLPIVTMIVTATYKSNDGFFQKSFIISAITVCLCSLWPTLMNTALGVSSISKDYMNVARVLKLRVTTQVFKIILPASLPLIFAGLRISLGVGWMVLIAAEMLAQNPGLGKFVWDEFQNGSSDSLAKIMVAVFTIGIIGFMLDRVMLTLQKLVSFEKK